MNYQLTEIADLLKVSELAAQIYVSLITHDDLSVKDLTELLDIAEKKVKTACDELSDKDLVWKVEGSGGEKLYSALSVVQLEEKLNRRKDTLEVLKTFVMPKLQPEDQLGIIKFEGWEGIRQAYIEVLEESKKNKEPIYAVEDNQVNTQIGEKFIEGYVNDRVENKIKAFVLCPHTPHDEKYHQDYNGKCTYVRLKDGLVAEANLNITGQLVMTYTVSPPEGTLRRSGAEAKTLRSMFELVWNEDDRPKL